MKFTYGSGDEDDAECVGPLDQVIPDDFAYQDDSDLQEVKQGKKTSLRN